MENLLGDIRYAMRQIAGDWRLTLTVCAMLTLGVGVNAAVFGLTDWLLFRPAPGVSHPERLIVAQFRDQGGRTALTSYPNLIDLGSRVPSLSGLAGYQSEVPVSVYIEGQRPRYLRSSVTSEDFFKVLGLHISPGHSFDLQDPLSANNIPGIVVSGRLWRGWLGGDKHNLGRIVSVNGVQARVIGVAPPGFLGVDRPGDTDIWIPGSAIAHIVYHGLIAPPRDERGEGVFSDLIGRLAPGASVQDARTQVVTTATNLRASYPAEDSQWRNPATAAGVGIPIGERDAVRRALVLVAAVAALVFLVACANVANLLLCRSVERRSEWAIRGALGASASRLLRLQLAESVLLALMAIAPALALAATIMKLFRGRIFPGLGSLQGVYLDWRAIAFASGISLAAAIVVGVTPALTVLRSASFERLKGAAHTQIFGGGRLRATLTAAQIAFSLSMLVLSLLLVGTLRNLRSINVGFEPDSVMTFSVAPSMAGFGPGESLNILRQSLANVQNIPGVTSAALAAATFFGTSISSRVRSANALPGDSGILVTPAWVSPDFFRVMGIRMLSGGTFEGNDLLEPTHTKQATSEVILSQSLAVRLFGHSNAVGRMIRRSQREPPARVVGIVADSRWSSLRSDDAVLVSYAPLPNIVASTGATFLVRSSLSSAALEAELRQAVGRVSESVPLFGVATLRQRIEAQMSESRMLARLLTTFTLLAIAVTVVGLYTVIVFFVRERARELSIRTALGASPVQIFALVLKKAAIIGACGSAGGLLGAVFLSRLISSQLYGLQPVNSAVYGAALGMLALFVLAGAFPAALTATRVSVMLILRAE